MYEIYEEQRGMAEDDRARVRVHKGYIKVATADIESTEPTRVR